MSLFFKIPCQFYFWEEWLSYLSGFKLLSIAFDMSVLQAFSPCDYTSLLSIQAPGDVTSFLMTEARQHNTEIRMAVSKVVDKMDHLAAKVMYGIGRLVNKVTASWSPNVSGVGSI